MTEIQTTFWNYFEISMLEETGLTKEGDAEVYPLLPKAEAETFKPL